MWIHGRQLFTKQSASQSKLLSLRRSSLPLDPILRLSISYSERSRCVRWGLDWLPGSQPKLCHQHPGRSLSKIHVIQCLDMHQRLQMPINIEDPLSFPLNMLPSRKPRSFQSVCSWFLHWHTICLVLFKLDHFHLKSYLSHLYYFPEKESWIGCSGTHTDVYDMSFLPYSLTFLLFF